MKRESINPLTNISAVDTMDGQELAAMMAAIMKKEKKLKLLQRHKQAITHGKDGRWRTKIKTPGGRIKDIRKPTRAELEDFLVEYYENEAEHQTVKTLFEEWIKNKEDLDGLRPSSIARYKTDARRFFTNDDVFCNMEITDITPADITAYIKRQIIKHGLTVKTYGGLRILIDGVLCLAKEKQLTDISMTQYFGDLVLPKNIFTARTQKADADEVFSDSEERALLNWLRTDATLLRLGVVLMFQTGLRVGELAALRPSDIDTREMTITVRRTEISFDDEDGHRAIGVSDEAKTEAGSRTVYLPDAALKTIKGLQRLNPFGEWLFSYDDGRRIHAKAFRDQLYRACRAVGIPERSTHKIRKTYLTELLDAGCGEKFVQTQGGHKDISTTRKYYHRDRMTGADKRAALNRIVNM